jgi:outer membrane protein
MQKVLLNSDMGKAAQIELEKKISELESTFKKEEGELKTLQDEIEKKSSVWSEEKKQEKAIEFQKLRRDLRVKQEDAQLELKQMQDKQVGPILRELEGVVEKYAKEKGLVVILPKEATLFRSSGVDITEEITQALNAATAK